jgi:hypothetical protein
MKVVLRLTRSQHMALSSILVQYALLKDQPQEFVDVAEDRTTTVGELLSAVIPLNEVEVNASEICMGQYADRQYGN